MPRRVRLFAQLRTLRLPFWWQRSDRRVQLPDGITDALYLVFANKILKQCHLLASHISYLRCTMVYSCDGYTADVTSAGWQVILCDPIYGT